jgi:hypothetical protein
MPEKSTASTKYDIGENIVTDLINALQATAL